MENILRLDSPMKKQFKQVQTESVYWTACCGRYHIQNTRIFVFQDKKC